MALVPCVSCRRPFYASCHDASCIDALCPLCEYGESGDYAEPDSAAVNAQVQAAAEQDHCCGEDVASPAATTYTSNGVLVEGWQSG